MPRLLALLLSFPSSLLAGGWLPVSSPPRVGAAAYDQSQATVASNGIDYLAAWTSITPGGSHVYATKVNSDGTLADEIAHQLDANAARAFAVSLTQGRDGYLASWLSENGLTAAITDSFGRIERQATIPRAGMSNGAVHRTLSAWNGSIYLVVTGFDHAIIGTTLDNNGSVLDANIPIGDMHGYITPAALIADREGFLLVVAKAVPDATRHDLYGIRIGNGGIGQWFLIRSVASPVSGVGVAFDGTTDVIAWSDQFGLWMAALDPQTNTTGLSRQLIPAASGIGRAVISGGKTWITCRFADRSWHAVAIGADGKVEQAGPGTDLAANGSSVFVIDSSSADVYGHFAASAANPFLVSKSQTDQQHGNVASDGHNVLAAWDEEIDHVRHILAGRLDPGGQPLDGQGLLISRAGDNTSPSAAFNGHDYLVAWHRNVDGKHEIAARRVSAAGQLLDAEDLILGDTNVEGEPSVASDGSGWLVMWGATVPGSGCVGYGPAERVFAGRVSADGTVLDPGGIAVTPASAPAPYDIDVAWTGSNYVAAWEGRCGLAYYAAISVTVETAFLSSDLSKISRGTPLALRGLEARPRVVPGPNQSLIAWNNGGVADFRVAGNAPSIPPRKRTARVESAPASNGLGSFVTAGRTRDGEFAILSTMTIPWASLYQGLFETRIKSDGTLSSRLVLIVESNETFAGRITQLGPSRFLPESRFEAAAGAERVLLRGLD
jgi:hypothetical protein